MLPNLYPLASIDFGTRPKTNLFISQVSNKNIDLMLLEQGICPYEFYAATGDLTTKISGYGYITPEVLDKYKYSPWALGQTKTIVSPELKRLSFEEVCEYFDEHPRMIQLIFNKHRSLTRSLPISRACNISDIARFILNMAKKAARILSRLNSNPYFQGYVENRLIDFRRPTDTTSKTKLLTEILLNYYCDASHILYSIISTLQYSILELMTHQNLTTLKNCAVLRRLFAGVVFSRDCWSSIRSSGYANGNTSGNYIDTNVKGIISGILGIITKLDHLSFMGTNMIPYAADAIESPSGDNIVSQKHMLMYNIAAAKIAELAPELGSMARDMYEFFFEDTDLSKALASKNLTPTTPMSSLSDTMSYYYNTGETSSLSGLSYHVYSNPTFHESVTIDYLFTYINNVRSYPGIYNIATEQQLSIYGSLDTIGAYYGHLGLSNRSSCGRSSYRLEHFIYELTQTPASKPILGPLAAEHWKLSIFSNLPIYAQAHMIFLNALLTLFWDVGRAEGTRNLKLQSLRSIFTPNSNNSYYLSEISANYEDPDREAKFDVVNSVSHGLSFAPTSNNVRREYTHASPTHADSTDAIRNFPKGTGGIYVKDYSSRDTARNFKVVGIGNRRYRSRR